MTQAFALTTCDLPSGKGRSRYDYAKDVTSCSATVATAKENTTSCCCLVAPTQTIVEVIKSPKSCEEVCRVAGLSCFTSVTQQVTCRDAQGNPCSTELSCRAQPSADTGCGKAATRAELSCR